MEQACGGHFWIAAGEGKLHPLSDWVKRPCESLTTVCFTSQIHTAYYCRHVLWTSTACKVGGDTLNGVLQADVKNEISSYEGKI